MSSRTLAETIEPIGREAETSSPVIFEFQLVVRVGEVPREPERVVVRVIILQDGDKSVASVSDIYPGLEQEPISDETRFRYESVAVGTSPPGSKWADGAEYAVKRSTNNLESNGAPMTWNRRMFFKIPPDGKMMRVWLDLPPLASDSDTKEPGQPAIKEERRPKFSRSAAPEEDKPTPASSKKRALRSAVRPREDQVVKKKRRGLTALAAEDFEDSGAESASRGLPAEAVDDLERTPDEEPRSREASPEAEAPQAFENAADEDDPVVADVIVEDEAPKVQPTGFPLVLSSWSMIRSLTFPANVSAFFAATDFRRQRDEFECPTQKLINGSVLAIQPSMNIVGGFGEPIIIVTKQPNATKIANGPPSLQVFLKRHVNNWGYIGAYRLVGGVRQASAKDLRTEDPENLALLRRLVLNHLSLDKKKPLEHSVKVWKFKIKAPKKTATNPGYDLEALTDAAMEDLKTNNAICITYLVLAPDGPIGYDLGKFAGWWEQRSQRVERNRNQKHNVREAEAVPGEVNGRLPSYMM